jgi:outer membrane protein assembly factor BamA
MHTSPVRSVLLALCLLSSSVQLFAQSFTLPPITFTGAPAFTQSDLLKVSGLKPGSTATQADVQAAAQRLSDTGLFSDVRFASTTKDLVYTLKPMPADNLLPAHFNNFIWWQPAELDSLLKSRVPLYLGTVPLSGNLQDQIVAALSSLLAERHITAKVIALPSVPTGGGTPTAIAFVIDTPSVLVHSLAVPSSSPAMQPKLEPVIKNITGKPWEEPATHTYIAGQIATAYRNEGYLDIALTSLTHAEPKITSDGIEVDLIATISEGEPYRLSTLTWPGSPILSTADFNKTVKLKPEDIASQLALRQSLAPLARAYFAKGFQDAKVQAPATLDPATHHVAYTIRVVPGDQYRLRTIKFNGLSEAQSKELNSAWRMKPGDFYDVNYMTEFLKQNSALQTLRGYSATYKAISDPDTHLVDLTVTFGKGGSLVEVN